MSRRSVTTSEDVARLAGVSQPTVSLVLAGRGDQMRVAAATQRRVRSAAESLGYIPNHAARSLRHSRSNTIAVISPSLDNPFFAEVIGAVQDAAIARGCSTNIVLARHAAEEAAAIARILAGTADAVVVASHYAANGDALDMLARHGIPCIVLQQCRRPAPVPVIAVDLETGGAIATAHLIGLGHRRIAHVTQSREHDGRRVGYLRALHAAGIAADPAMIVEAENSLAGGSQAAQRLPHSCTAVFVYNDQMALGLLHGARRAGRRVPDDLAVIGFDNTIWSGFSNPALSTVAHERNRLTVATLFAMLDGAPPPGEPQIVPVTLVIRHSCGAVRPPPDHRAARG